MNKILSGIIGIVAVVGVVGASAYALFTAQATLSGINLTTGTAELFVGPGSVQPTQSSVNLGVTDNLVPGETPERQLFTLRNNSNEVDFNITAQLTSAGGDWAALSGLINATVWADLNDNGVVDGGEASVTGSLADWNSTAHSLPGNPLASESNQTYIVEYSLSGTAGNEASGKSLSDITFVFTGTQVETPTP